MGVAPTDPAPAPTGLMAPAPTGLTDTGNTDITIRVTHMIIRPGTLALTLAAAPGVSLCKAGFASRIEATSRRRAIESAHGSIFVLREADNKVAQ
jgi:hypothetical protein